MSRGFSSKSFALAASLPPATYTELVAIFGGDAGAANAWLLDWIDYAETGAQSEALIAALRAAGPPQDVITIATARPAGLANDWASALEVPYPAELAIGIATTPLAGAIGVANDF